MHPLFVSPVGLVGTPLGVYNPREIELAYWEVWTANAGALYYCLLLSVLACATFFCVCNKWVCFPVKLGRRFVHGAAPPTPPTSMSVKRAEIREAVRANGPQKCIRKAKAPMVFWNPLPRRHVTPPLSPCSEVCSKTIALSGLASGWRLSAAPSPLGAYCYTCVPCYRRRKLTPTPHLGNAMHAVRTQYEVLDVGKYSNPSFGSFSQVFGSVPGVFLAS